MRLRHLTIAALIVPAILLSACSGDDEPDETTTSTTSTTVAETTTTISDAEYRAATEEAVGEIGSNAGNLCALVRASASFPAPTNSTQVEATTELIERTYGAIADVIADADPASADALRKGAAAIVAEAAEAGYPADFFSGISTPAAMADPQFQAAMGVVQAAYAQECSSSPDDGPTLGEDGPSTDEGADDEGADG